MHALSLLVLRDIHNTQPLTIALGRHTSQSRQVSHEVEEPSPTPRGPTTAELIESESGTRSLTLDGTDILPDLVGMVECLTPKFAERLVCEALQGVGVELRAEIPTVTHATVTREF